MDSATPILEVIALTSANLSLDKIMAALAEKIAQLIGAENCTISSWHPQNDTITILANYTSSSNHQFQDRTPGTPHSRYPTLTRALREQTLEIMHFDNSIASRSDHPFPELASKGSLLLIPLLYNKQAVGLLELYTSNRNSGHFEPENAAFYYMLANLIAQAIEHNRLHQEASEGRLHAEAMQVIGQALASELDDQRIVHNVADFAYRLVGAQFVYVAVPESEGFRLVATAGQPNKRATAIQYIDTSLDIDSPLDWVIWERRSLIVADTQTAPSSLTDWRTKAEAAGWRSMVAVPMLSYNRLIGVLAAYTNQANFFTNNDVSILMSLASQAAAAIQNAQLFAEREAQRETLHQISLRLINAQEAERRRISREIHDELGQALTALKINLDVARQALPAEAAPRLKRSINEASRLAGLTLETARNLSLELHPAILDDLGLVAALRWKVDQYEQSTGQPVKIEVNLADANLKPELEMTIYRIVIEALTNVSRHAQASHVSIKLYIENDQIITCIKDDGIGFDPARRVETSTRRRSLGLVGMRERAELLKGTFELTSQRQQGTIVRVALPIAD